MGGIGMAQDTASGPRSGRRLSTLPMRLNIEATCQWCHERRPVDVELAATWWEWSCPACGEPNSVLTATGMTIGRRMLMRAQEEYRRGDYTMAIVLCAMAFEAELARVFVKWSRIDTLTRKRMPDDEAIEKEYRRLGRNVATKIDAVATLLDARGLDGFASGHPLGQTITKDFPSLNVGSLADDIQRALFWPRNRILHAGHTDYRKEDALRCYNIAQFAIALLREMDLARQPQ
jgi:hypothetical protein